MKLHDAQGQPGDIHPCWRFGILLLPARDEDVSGQEEALSRMGFLRVVATDTDDAITGLRNTSDVTVIIMDGRALGEGASRFLDAIDAVHRPELLVLGYGCEEFRSLLHDRGERLFLPTPWSADDVLSLATSRYLTMRMMNLQDAFLNAALAKRVMDRSPVEGPPHSPQLIHVRDRFRAERMWIALLAVLIESWDSDMMRPVRDYLASATDTSNLTELLREARRQELRQRLTDVRGYMFHRDKRHYYDEGLFGPLMQLEFFSQLHAAFSAVLLAGIRSLRQDFGDDASPKTHTAYA